MYRSQNGGCAATGAGARERAFISSGARCAGCSQVPGCSQVNTGDHWPLTRGCTVGIQGEHWPYGALWELWRWLSRCTVGIFAHSALWHVTMALIAEQHVATVWLQWMDVVICLMRQINIIIGTCYYILDRNCRQFLILECTSRSRQKCCRLTSVLVVKICVQNNILFS